MFKQLSLFFNIFLCLAIIASSFVFGASLQARNQKFSEILVKFQNEANFRIIKIEENQDLNETLEYYREMENVEYAEPNYIYHISALPDDDYYSKQWYFQKIKAPSVWDKISSSPNITVAIIDSGIQIDHPDLKENIWVNTNEIPDNGVDDDKNGFIDDYNGWDFINNTPDPSPKFEQGFTEAGVLHGTIVAGVLAAEGNNEIGVAGVTWRAKIMPLQVLNDRGEGKVSDVIRAIDYAIKNEADIINLSFVGFDYSQGMYEVIKKAYNAGILVVAAAGNEQDQGHGYDLDQIPMYPVCLDGDNGENMVIGVAATDDLDEKTDFSSYGFKCIDITAPGVKIFSTSVYAPKKSIDNNYFNKYYDGYWSGTSMATPMVSGAIALIKEVNPNLKTSRIRDILFSSSDNISRLNPDYLGQLGSGRLNLERALLMAVEDLKSSETRILIAPQSNMESQVKMTTETGEQEGSFLAYNSNFQGGANIASGDFDGDGVDEIITGAGPGGGPHVRIFDKDGNVKTQFFAFNPNFRGGVTVAAGDLDGDGIDEIITGIASSGDPYVRIFDISGKVEVQFSAYNKNFQGGVNVASGDLDGDGIDEIITGAGNGGGPQIRIFDGAGKVKGQFFAYDKNLRGGVNVVVSNVIKNGRAAQDEIITGAGSGDGPRVRIFDSHGKTLYSFFAYQKDFRGGVNVGLGDFNRDGLDEIITGAGITGGPHVRVFSVDGTLLKAFYAYDRKFPGGVKVSSIKIKK